jgi:hypothetical protein
MEPMAGVNPLAKSGWYIEVAQFSGSNRLKWQRKIS